MPTDMTRVHNAEHCSRATTLYANYCHDSYRCLDCLDFQALIRPCPHPQLQNPLYAGWRQTAMQEKVNFTRRRRSLDGQWAWIPSAGA